MSGGRRLSAWTHVVSKAQVEFLQDEQVSAEQSSGHGHVTDGLTDDGDGGAAAVQLGQADPGVQTCKTQIGGETNASRTLTAGRSAVTTKKNPQRATFHPQIIFLPGGTGASPPISESVSRSISLIRTIMAAIGFRMSCSLFWISSITLSLQEKRCQSTN